MRAKNEVNFDRGMPRLFWTPRWPLPCGITVIHNLGARLHILFDIGARRRSADT